jgi:hypothetical protein
MSKSHERSDSESEPFRVYMQLLVVFEDWLCATSQCIVVVCPITENNRVDNYINGVLYDDLIRSMLVVQETTIIHGNLA